MATKAKKVNQFSDADALAFLNKKNMPKKINMYAFRFEAPIDLLRLKDALSTDKTLFLENGDVCTLATTMSLEAVRKAVAKIPDGDVMLDTCEKFEDYTGVRQYRWSKYNK